MVIGSFVVALLLVAAGFALVNGKWLPRLTNFNPGVFALDYRTARWVPPFSVEAEGVDIQVQSDGYRVWITAEEASGTFEPSKMFALRVAFTDIRARGVSVRVRLPKPSEGTAEARLPRMDGLSAPGVSDPDGASFSVQLIDLHDVRVREVWIDGYQYEGEISVSGGFTLDPLVTLRIEPSTVFIDGGVLTLPNTLEAKFEPSTISGRVRELAIDSTLTPAAFRNLDATAALAFQAPNLNLLNTALLADVPDVRVLYGSGGVSMNVSVDAGVVDDGSEVKILRRRLGVRVPHFDVVGNATVKVLAKDGHIEANATIDDFELDALDDDRLVASGKRFSLSATTTGSDLAASPQVDVTMHLEEAKAPTLTFLARYIPEGTGIVLAGGGGRIGADATLSTRTQRAEGTLTLRGTNVELHNRAARVTGALELKAVVRDYDLRTRSMNLGGSELKLTDVLVSTPLDRFQSVWLTALATDARFAPGTARPWKVSLGVSARNVQPLLALISGSLKIPRWVGSLDLPGAAAHVELQVEGKNVSLSPLTLRTDGLSLDARLVLTELPDKTFEPHGVGLLRVGVFEAGIQIDGGTITPVLIGGRQWFAEQLDGGR